MLCQDGVCGDSIRVIVKPALGYNLKLQKRLKEKPCVSLFFMGEWYKWRCDVCKLLYYFVKFTSKYFYHIINLHNFVFYKIL